MTRSPAAKPTATWHSVSVAVTVIGPPAEAEAPVLVSVDPPQPVKTVEELAAEHVLELAYDEGFGGRYVLHRDGSRFWGRLRASPVRWDDPAGTSLWWARAGTQPRLTSTRISLPSMRSGVTTW